MSEKQTCTTDNSPRDSWNIHQGRHITQTAVGAATRSGTPRAAGPLLAPPSYKYKSTAVCQIWTHSSREFTGTTVTHTTRHWLSYETIQHLYKLRCAVGSQTLYVCSERLSLGAKGEPCEVKIFSQ